ncbi:uncharacterized protein AMSG_07527 [Thecamonas trahens ATCC 50062]|uniref:Translin-associated factor X-interacting protein 1 N-terminal domain-containing protein n=1 Tax=Thecamonas trahens ATCC 50062 TaxID=461836 RepID=A0A0L0DHE2_THETB|nr:hypothetical protein AMSG_07527 [Thecamonas trahens ATCC 50062]KNC51615.1 hypothetical protein AMSG_07527 [Thecamonas trahens ATCC 50062]|eukprot:XP_013756011.1 hypothetical protein AMSG_07527 [Thecamonas trahens ATCC 50062]
MSLRRSYSLSNTDEVFYLPDPKALPTYDTAHQAIDRKTAIPSGPVASAKPQPQPSGHRSISADHSLAGTRSRLHGAAAHSHSHGRIQLAKAIRGARASSTRPKFVRELERFIASELAALKDATGTEAEPVYIARERVQIFREVFALLIEEFDVYKSLLATIKSEYEAALSTVSREVDALRPMRPALATLKRETTDEVARLQDEHARVVAQLKAQRTAMQEHMAKQRAQLEAEQAEKAALHDRLLTAETLTQHKSQMHKLLYDRIHAKDAELAVALSAHRDISAKYAASKKRLEDVLFELRQTEDDLVILRKSLQEMRPAAEVAALEEAAAADAATIASLEAALSAAEEQLRMARAQSSRAEAAAAGGGEAGTAVSSGQATPLGERSISGPHGLQGVWGHSGSAGDVDSGRAAALWAIWSSDFALLSHTNQLALRRMVAAGASVDEVVAVLMQGLVELERRSGVRARIPEAETDLDRTELAARMRQSQPGEFPAPGTGPNVPTYRATDAPVPNLQFGKRKTEDMIAAIWAARDESKSGVDLETFLTQWSHKRYGPRAALMMINLEEACLVWSADPDCALYLAIIHNAVPESVRHDEASEVDTVIAHLRDADAAVNGGRAKGKLLLTQMTDAQLDALVGELKYGLTRGFGVRTGNNSPNPPIRYEALFEDDKFASQSPFAEELRHQHLEAALQRDTSPPTSPSTNDAIQ